MKKMTVLLFISAIFACERNEPDNLINRFDYIVIGDSTNCIVEKPGSRTYDEMYSIDIDKDGLEDFVLYHYQMHKWDASYVTLKCLNNDSYVNVKNVIDTTYLQFLMDSMEHNGLYVINIMDIFNCNKDNPYGYNQFDSVYEITSKAYINSFDAEDTLSRRDVWICDSLELALTDRFEPSGMPDTIIVSEIMDTAIYVSYMWIQDCHLFPSDIEKYIGVKKGDRLGWIKISIYDNCETLIHEIVLQE